MDSKATEHNSVQAQDIRVLSQLKILLCASKVYECALSVEDLQVLIGESYFKLCGGVERCL